MTDCDDCTPTQAGANAVRGSLRELTANLLRIARGAGRHDQVLAQTLVLAELFTAYRATAGADFPDEEVARALTFADVPDGHDHEGWPDWDRAVRAMVKGALQVAAAELLGQPAQAATGRRELFAGYRLVERLHTRQLRRLMRF